MAGLVSTVREAAESARRAAAQVQPPSSTAATPSSGVAAAEGTSPREGGVRRFWQRPPRVRAQLLSITLSQLADLLTSGVPLLRALEVLERQASHPTLNAVLRDVRTQVSEGATLDAAMARHSQVFSELTVSMARAGAEGGFLEDVLKRTADFIEHQEDLKGRVVGAATYPVILAIAGFSATTVLVVFFVPKFAELFERLKQRGELPAVTSALLWTSDFLGRYGLLLLAALAGAGWWGVTRLRTEEGRRWADRWKLKLPLAGPILLSLAVARFCRVLGTLLKNGVAILKALEISSDSTGNRMLSAAIRSAADNISAGQSLAAPLSACGLFPQTVVEMISVAEESNNLENVLVSIADGLERRTQRQLDLLVRLLEPAMLLVMACVVLLVVVALLLPVFQMSAAMN